MTLLYPLDAELDSDVRLQLLGKKAAGLSEMTALGIPVPPGFTLTTEACRSYLAEGWTDALETTLGRVLRSGNDDDFPDGSGLNGTWSDYVGAVALRLDSGLRLSNRALFDDEARFRRNELALDYEDERADLTASYTYFAQEENNPINQNHSF